jgi:hypothetical protein
MSDDDDGGFEEPVEPMDEDREEDNMLYEELEEAQVDLLAFLLLFSSKALISSSFGAFFCCFHRKCWSSSFETTFLFQRNLFVDVLIVFFWKRLREQAGDANGDGEKKDANDLDATGIVEMRHEQQDDNDELIFEPIEANNASQAAEESSPVVVGEKIANAVRVTRPWLSKQKNKKQKKKKKRKKKFKIFKRMRFWIKWFILYIFSIFVLNLFVILIFLKLLF